MVGFDVAAASRVSVAADASKEAVIQAAKEEPNVARYLEEGVHNILCLAGDPPRDAADDHGPGDPDGRLWNPGECDVPLPGYKWFWHGEAQPGKPSDQQQQQTRGAGHSRSHEPVPPLFRHPARRRARPTTAPTT